jgi:hypothetical protein
MGYEYKGKGVSVGGTPLNITTKPVRQPSKTEEIPEISLKKQTSSTDKSPSLQKQISTGGSLSGVGIKPTHGHPSSNPNTNLPQTSLQKQNSIPQPTLTKQSSIPKTTSPSIPTTQQKKDIKEEGGIKTINPSISKPNMMGTSKPSVGTSGTSVTKPPTSSNSNSSTGSTKPPTQSIPPSNLKKK